MSDELTCIHEEQGRLSRPAYRTRRGEHQAVHAVRVRQRDIVRHAHINAKIDEVFALDERIERGAQRAVVPVDLAHDIHDDLCLFEELRLPWPRLKLFR